VKNFLIALALAMFAVATPASAYWASICITVQTQPLGSGYVRARCQYGYTGTEYLVYSHVTNDCTSWWSLHNNNPEAYGAEWFNWDESMHATHSPGHAPTNSLDWPCGEGWWDGEHTLTGKKRSDGLWDYVVIDTRTASYLNAYC
jgi:hypothetical protein